MKPTNLLIAACLAIMATIAACSKKITDPSASENISGWFVGYWHINDVESSPQKAVDGEGYYFLSHQENTENLNWYIFFGGDRRYSAIYETAESSIIRHNGTYTYAEDSYVDSRGVRTKILTCKVGDQTINTEIIAHTMSQIESQPMCSLTANLLTISSLRKKSSFSKNRHRKGRGG